MLAKYNVDDETYVKADFQQLPGRQFYVQKIGTTLNMKYKIIKMDKFPKKFMVWQAICSCGKRSTPFVTSKTMNQDVYIKECLQKRIIPLINQHDSDVLFWPDLASFHYAKKTIAWYEANGVPFVSKTSNPPKCLKLRPIETFWALYKINLKEVKF